MTSGTVKDIVSSVRGRLLNLAVINDRSAEMLEA
jgi:hypothetical protein